MSSSELPPPAAGFELRTLSGDELAELAADRVPPALAPFAEEGALPPPFVVRRALALGSAGHALPWSTVYLIVDAGPGRIVGSCGFKSAPSAGRVDFGYGVAATARRRGAGGAAVARLLDLASDAGVGEVLAEIALDNAASAAVVRRAGFRSIGPHVDANGEFVDRWLHVRAPRPDLSPVENPACTTRS